MNERGWKGRERGLKKKGQSTAGEEETSIDERQASSHLPLQFYGSQIADRLSFPIRQLGISLADQFFFSQLSPRAISLPPPLPPRPISGSHPLRSRRGRNFYVTRFAMNIDAGGVKESSLFCNWKNFCRAEPAGRGIKGLGSEHSVALARWRTPRYDVSVEDFNKLPKRVDLGGLYSSLGALHRRGWKFLSESSDLVCFWSD